MNNQQKTEKTTTNSFSGVELSPDEARALRALASASGVKIGEFLADCFRTMLKSQYAEFVQAMPKPVDTSPLHLAAAD
ncbi:MAG: hypothetical protein AAGK98_18760 [Pseudomonadota bacterium]